MKRVLIYVLTSSHGPYPTLAKTSMETWDSPVIEGIETRFYSNPQPHAHPKILQFRSGDALHDMGRKDLMAYEWALTQLPFHWDYMARVSASCYVAKQRVLDYCQDLPEIKLFRGVGARKPDGTKYLWGGTHYIISRDVVKAMVDNKSKWNHMEMEDVAMSVLVSSLGIPLDGQGHGCSIDKMGDHWVVHAYYDGKIDRFEFRDFAEFKARTMNQFFVRVKQDGRRELDSWLMRELFKIGMV